MNSITIEEFEARVLSFPWKGEVTEFHMHHTADPKATWKGAASVESIRQAHLKREFRQGAAQHVLLDPNGSIWLGRDWNYYPASTNAKGRNGKDNGPRPFMIETFGDFRTDKLDGAQLANLIRIIASVQERWGLAPDAIVFHKEMEPTACPGNLDKALLVAQVRTYRQEHYGSPAPHQPYDPPETWLARLMRGLLGQRS